MSQYIHELLCVDSLGNVSVSHLAVEDTDQYMASSDINAVYTLDGTVLATSPLVTVGELQFTLLSGAARSTLAMSFSEGGNTYYLMSDSYPADAVATAGTFTSFGPVGGINYTVYGATEGDIPRPYQGDALVLTYNASDVLTGSEVSTFTVYDDDRLIQFDGQNGAPDSETGDAANGHFGYQGREFSFNTTNAGAGDTQMVLVEVDYDGPGGTGTFEAIMYRYQLGGDYAVAYIPRTGSVDLADVGTVTGVTVLATSLDGALYTDFGLNFSLTTVNGIAADDFLTGTWLHDKFNGKGGADSLLGSMGEDQLYGGGGGDHLFGGMHADTLDGGGGTDILHGGSYDDSLIGGEGADDIFGGWGADTLDGGKKADSLQGNDDADVITGGAGSDTVLGGNGNDTIDGGDNGDDLRGGAGDDHMTDGSGSDILTGNGGSDTFVFGTDGETDTVEDYRDGTDLIDLDVAFNQLTFTDVAPGEVHVTHSGETLILLDTTGTLTSADLTNADFL